MDLLRLLVASGLVTAGLGLAPAQANECPKPAHVCGSCEPNWEMSTEDLRPIVCHV